MAKKIAGTWVEVAPTTFGALADGAPFRFLGQPDTAPVSFRTTGASLAQPGPGLAGSLDDMLDPDTLAARDSAPVMALRWDLI